uniref:Uncharacterized protein n=1 Tax=Plectus sambesii TaxID=2011161 RepID=A0A914VGN1_9BILA
MAATILPLLLLVMIAFLNANGLPIADYEATLELQPIESVQYLPYYYRQRRNSLGFSKIHRSGWTWPNNDDRTAAIKFYVPKRYLTRSLIG